MFTAEMLERAAKSAVQAFLVAFAGSVLASLTSGIQWSAPWWQSVEVAAVAAGGMAAASAVTSFISKPFGVPGSASVLPAAISVDSVVTSTTPLIGQQVFTEAAKAFPARSDPETHLGSDSVVPWIAPSAVERAAAMGTDVPLGHGAQAVQQAPPAPTVYTTQPVVAADHPDAHPDDPGA